MNQYRKNCTKILFPVFRRFSLHGSKITGRHVSRPPFIGGPLHQAREEVVKEEDPERQP